MEEREVKQMVGAAYGHCVCGREVEIGLYEEGISAGDWVEGVCACGATVQAKVRAEDVDEGMAGEVAPEKGEA